MASGTVGPSGTLGNDLQAAINQAQPGDVISLDHTQTFSPNAVTNQFQFNLPLVANPNGQYITIQSDDYLLPTPHLPAVDSAHPWLSSNRVSPSLATYMGKISGSTDSRANAEPVLYGDRSSAYWKLRGLQISAAPGAFPQHFLIRFDTTQAGNGTGDAWTTKTPANYQMITSGAITANTDVTVTVGSTSRMSVGMPLIINPASGDQEVVVVEQVLSATQFRAFFTLAHASGALVCDDLPHHIWFDQCYIYNQDPQTYQSLTVKEAFLANCGYFALTNSYLQGWASVIDECKCFLAYSGCGPYRIINNYLEAAGENFMFGGTAPSWNGVQGMVIDPTTGYGIVIQYNSCTANLAWNPSYPGYVPRGDGKYYISKNRGEFKSAMNALVDHNLFEKCWIPVDSGCTVRGQDGGGFLINMTNISGVGIERVRNVTFTNNRGDQLACALNIAYPITATNAQLVTGITIRNNLYTNLGWQYGFYTDAGCVAANEQTITSGSITASASPQTIAVQNTNKYLDTNGNFQSPLAVIINPGLADEETVLIVPPLIDATHVTIGKAGIGGFFNKNHPANSIVYDYRLEAAQGKGGLYAEHVDGLVLDHNTFRIDPNANVTTYGDHIVRNVQFFIKTAPQGAGTALSASVSINNFQCTNNISAGGTYPYDLQPGHINDSSWADSTFPGGVIQGNVIWDAGGTAHQFYKLTTNNDFRNNADGGSSSPTSESVIQFASDSSLLSTSPYKPANWTGGFHTTDGADPGCNIAALAFGSGSGPSDTLSLSSSANPASVGQAINFTASIVGSGSTFSPTGTVQFQADGSNLGIPVNVVGNGTNAQAVSNSISTLTQGNHTITAIYSGDSIYPGGQTSITETIQGAKTTTTTVISGKNPCNPGDTVTFTTSVTASGTTPQGSVQMNVNGTDQGSPATLDGTGKCSIPLTFSTVGTYAVKATYHSSGQNQWADSFGTVTGGQVVGSPPTTTVVTGSPNPATTGTSVTFTATVSHTTGSATPTGNVQFQIDGTNVGSPVAVGTVGGVTTASFTTSSLAIGSHSVVAVYGSDSNYGGSTSSAYTETIQPVGGVTANRVQSIGWETGDTSECFASNGTGVSVVTTPTAGSSYALKLNRSGSVANVDIRGYGANGLAAFYNLATAYYKFDLWIESYNGEFGLANCNDTGGTGKFFLHVDSTGHLKAFNAAGSVIGTGTTVLLAAQYYRIECKVGTGTSAAWEVRVNGATEISGTADLGTANNGAINLGGGSAYTSVQYYDNFAVDGQNWCGPSHISCLRPNRAGTYTAWTNGTGPSDYTQVADAVPDGDTTYVATNSIGLGAAFTAGFQPSSTFSVGTVACIKGVAIARNAGGGASPMKTRLRQNSTDFDAASSVDPGTTYAVLGDIENADKTTGNPWQPSAIDGLEFGLVSQSNNPARCTFLGLMVETVLWNAAVTIRSNPNPSAFGQSVTFFSTVSSSLATPTGSVQFQDSGSNLGSALTLSGGVAQFSTTGLSQAVHSITAVYSGDTNFQSTTSPTLAQNVTASKATSSTTMTATPNPASVGQNVTFSATVNKGTGSATPTGTVQFQIDGNTTRAPVGVLTTGNTTTATDNSSSLAAGTHSIVAVYSGDANYTGSSSSSFTETIQQGFTLPDGLLLVCTSPSGGSTPTGVIGVDLTSGVQSLISVGGNFVLPESVKQGPDGHLYVPDFSAAVAGAVIKIDFNTGAQSIVASGGSVNGPVAVAITPSFLYIANSSGTPNLVEINLNTGGQRVVSTGGSFQGPVALVLGTANNIYWADETAGGNGTIFSVNLSTGAQTQLTVGGSLNQMIDMEMEASGSLLAFNANGSIIRVNTSTGAQSAAYSGGSLGNLDGGTVDVNHAGLIVVSELAQGATPARIVSVNPNTLAQTVVTSGGNLALVTGLVVYTKKTVDSIIVTSSLNPSTFGQNVTFTARVN